MLIFSGMSINDLLEKIKPFYTIILLVTIGSIFFALGRLSSKEIDSHNIKIQYPNAGQTSSVISAVSTSTKSIKKETVVQVAPVSSSSEVIGSKSGKKYYYPWCGTVKRIKPENQIHFASIEEARKAGFVPGGNCKGLK